MITPSQLQQLCIQYNLAPIFFNHPATNDTVVSLDGTYPNQGLAIHVPEHLKLWSEAPDYPDPHHPWRPYIPGIFNEAPTHFRWINWRLFRFEAYRMVTNSSPYQLTEEASLNIVRSFAQISMIRQDITELFPWLSNSTFTLPPPPTPDLLQTKEDRRSVEATIGRAGLEALDIIGLGVFCSYNHVEPLGPSSLDDILPWSRHALRGVVLDLETTTLPDLSLYIQHHVPVYYICRRGEPTPFPPQLIDAKDRDGEVGNSHRDAMSARKASKATVRSERRRVREAGPSGTVPVQPGKKRFFLRHNNRFKQVSKKAFGNLQGKISTYNLPTGIVDILDVDEEPSDDETFSDTNPVPDMFFVRGRSSAGQSSYTRPPPLTTPFTYTDGEPGWTSRIPSPNPRRQSSPVASQQPLPHPQSVTRRASPDPPRLFSIQSTPPRLPVSLPRSRSPGRRSRSPEYRRRPYHRPRSPHYSRRPRSPSGPSRFSGRRCRGDFSPRGRSPHRNVCSS